MCTQDDVADFAEDACGPTSSDETMCVSTLGHKSLLSAFAVLVFLTADILTGARRDLCVALI